MSIRVEDNLLASSILHPKRRSCLQIPAGSRGQIAPSDAERNQRYHFCVLLKIDKIEMIRALHQEHASDISERCFFDILEICFEGCARAFMPRLTA